MRAELPIGQRGPFEHGPRHADGWTQACVALLAPISALLLTAARVGKRPAF